MAIRNSRHGRYLGGDCRTRPTGRGSRAVRDDACGSGSRGRLLVPRLPHHRPYGSVHGGSPGLLEADDFMGEAHEDPIVEETLGAGGVHRP